MDFWIWAILLLMTGLGLAALEMFVPSGGVLGFLSACAIVGSIVLGFRQSPALGFGLLVLALFGVPTVISVGLHYWPRTAMGRKILLGAPTSEEVLPDDPRKKTLKGLIGQVGRAKSKMLPSGVITVDGRTIDAVSEGAPVEPGQPVRIIEVRANRVVVRPVAEETEPVNPDDPLNSPVDSVVPDPFDPAAG